MAESSYTTDHAPYQDRVSKRNSMTDSLKRMLTRAWTVVIATALATAGVAAVAAPAMATGEGNESAPDPSEVDRAPEVVEGAEQQLGLNDDQIDDEVAVFQSGAQAVLEEGAQDLTVTFGAGDGDVSAEQSSSASSGVTHTLDQLDESTVRLASVHESAEENTASWDFGEGNILHLLDDGRVSVSDAEGNLVAGIEAPWAVDANGTELETYYSVEGTRLVQTTVFTEETAFPVVADPKLKTYIGYYTITFSHTETLTVIGTLGSCSAFLAKAPHPAMKALVIGCATLAAFTSGQAAGGKCLKVHIVGVPPAMSTWWPTFPKC